MNLNKAMIIGNLTRDPELRTIPSGIPVANFGVATNRVYTDQDGNKQETVEFHNIVVWRRLAEICNQYLRKGSKVYIEGRLQTRSWDDPNGFKRYKTEIVAENLIMLDRAPSTGSSVQAPGLSATPPQASSPQALPQANNAAYTPAEETTAPPQQVDQPSPSVAATPAQPGKPAVPESEQDLPTIDISEEVSQTDTAENEEAEVLVEDIPF